MIDPFLYTSLQFHFVQPIDIIGSCFIVRRFFDQFVQFFLRIVFFSIKTIYLHPSFEVMMENCVFFPAVPYFIDKIYSYIFIIWINFSSSFLNWQENWFNSRSGLSHQTRTTGRCNCQQSNVSSTVFYHVLVQLRSEEHTSELQSR